MVIKFSPRKALFFGAGQKNLNRLNVEIIEQVIIELRHVVLTVGFDLNYLF